MDSIRLIYQELFTIQFLHNRYSFTQHNSLEEDISVKPDKLTKEMFRNYMIDCKFFNNTFICFIRCNLLNPPVTELKVPFIKISGDSRFRFLMRASTSYFNKTDIEIAGAKQIYQFSNRSNIGTNNFISQHEDRVNDDDLSDASIVEAKERCLAVLDIYSSGAINNNYDLFSGAVLQLKSPVYFIRFKEKTII